MSPIDIPTEISSSTHSPEDSLPPSPLSTTLHVASYGIDQHPMALSRILSS